MHTQNERTILANNFSPKKMRLHPGSYSFDETKPHAYAGMYYTRGYRLEVIASLLGR